MYARATGPRDLRRHPPGKITPLAGAKESSPVKIDFRPRHTPPDAGARASPQPPRRRPILPPEQRRLAGDLPRSPHCDRQSTELLPARPPAANCTRLAAHSVRSDLSTDGLCRSHEVHKMRRPATPPSAKSGKYRPGWKAGPIAESGSGIARRQTRDARRRRRSVADGDERGVLL